MIKATILLPINFNDGQPVPESDVVFCLDLLAQLCDGYTLQGMAVGKYKMDDGKWATDTCHVVWVVCEDSKLDSLRDWAKYVAKTHKQESIYLEYHQVAVDFVRA